MEKKEFREAKKYVNVRYGYMKTKIVLAVFMLVCFVLIAMQMVDMGVIAGMPDVSDEEAIPVFIVALIGTVANLYIIISRIVWIIKYGKKDEDMEDKICKDAKMRKYLAKISDQKPLRRFTSSLYLIEGIALFIVLYVYMMGIAVVTVIKIGLKVTGHSGNITEDFGNWANSSSSSNNSYEKQNSREILDYNGNKIGEVDQFDNILNGNIPTGLKLDHNNHVVDKEGKWVGEIDNDGNFRRY